jgi:hypothetical protein
MSSEAVSTFSFLCADTCFSTRSSKDAVSPALSLEVDATILNTPLGSVLSNTCPRLLSGTGMQFVTHLISLLFTVVLLQH